MLSTLLPYENVCSYWCLLKTIGPRHPFRFAAGDGDGDGDLLVVGSDGLAHPSTRIGDLSPPPAAWIPSPALLLLCTVAVTDRSSRRARLRLLRLRPTVLCHFRRSTRCEVSQPPVYLIYLRCIWRLRRRLVSVH